MSIEWLGHVTFSGVSFQKGDNGEQLFYETESDGVIWNVIRPYILIPILPGTEPPDDGRCHIPYWFAYADRAGALKSLNTSLVGLDGIELKDPLYDATDSGYDDPPIQLLTAIAEFINQGADPWQLGKLG